MGKSLNKLALKKKSMEREAIGKVEERGQMRRVKGKGNELQPQNRTLALLQ